MFAVEINSAPVFCNNHFVENFLESSMRSAKPRGVPQLLGQVDANAFVHPTLT